MQDPNKAPENAAEPDLDEALQLRNLPPPWDRIFSLGTRLFVWGVLAAVIYTLQPFFLLVFLTFVFAYILEHGVHGTQHRIRNRSARVVLVASVFLGTLVLLGIFLTPLLIDQASHLSSNFETYLEVLDRELLALRESLGLQRVIPEDMKASELVLEYVGYGPSADATDTLPDDAEERRRVVEQLVSVVGNVGPWLMYVASTFLLSLLLSFLIVLDLPALERGVRSLERTKLRFLYVAAADNIREFGLVLGRALEAQVFIAMCNTVLTAIGLSVLGMTDNLVFFSTVVFLFSFIPVAGVFISSTPICLHALTERGLEFALVVVAMITIVHMVEAYVLNPRIFGHHLRMNPVLVLIVLIIAGKSFGIWGLILGLPIVNYFFTRAIRPRVARQGTTPEPVTAG